MILNLAVPKSLPQTNDPPENNLIKNISPEILTEKIFNIIGEIRKKIQKH